MAWVLFYVVFSSDISPKICPLFISGIHKVSRCRCSELNSWSVMLFSIVHLCCFTNLLSACTCRSQCVLQGLLVVSHSIPLSHSYLCFLRSLAWRQLCLSLWGHQRHPNSEIEEHKSSSWVKDETHCIGLSLVNTGFSKVTKKWSKGGVDKRKICSYSYYRGWSEERF